MPNTLAKYVLDHYSSTHVYSGLFTFLTDIYMFVNKCDMRISKCECSNKYYPLGSLLSITKKYLYTQRKNRERVPCIQVIYPHERIDFPLASKLYIYLCFATSFHSGLSPFKEFSPNFDANIYIWKKGPISRLIGGQIESDKH